MCDGSNMIKPSGSLHSLTTSLQLQMQLFYLSLLLLLSSTGLHGLGILLRDGCICIYNQSGFHSRTRRNGTTVCFRGCKKGTLEKFITQNTKSPNKRKISPTSKLDTVVMQCSPACGPIWCIPVIEDMIDGKVSFKKGQAENLAPSH